MFHRIAFACVVTAMLARAAPVHAEGECGSATIAENVANSSVALFGRVVQTQGSPVSDSAASILAGYVQTVRVKVVRSWKGPFQPSAAFTTTVRVVTVCAGFGCVFPFNVGEEFVLLSPTTSLELGKFCWVLRGTDSTLAISALEAPSDAGQLPTGPNNRFERSRVASSLGQGGSR